ncbi:MAG: hypothetical protein AAGD07_19405 [Planctomycetota bacterium]
MVNAIKKMGRFVLAWGVIASTLYRLLADACDRGAPQHLFFGERFQLRDAPDEVLVAVGKHVDVFCTQALIRSPQRPPEWQLFQAERYDYERALTGKLDGHTCKTMALNSISEPKSHAKRTEKPSSKHFETRLDAVQTRRSLMLFLTMCGTLTARNAVRTIASFVSRYCGDYPGSRPDVRGLHPPSLGR